MSLEIIDTIHRLQRYNNSPSPILSIYFMLPASKLVRNKTIVNQLQTFIDTALSLEQRTEMRAQIEYIEGFLQNYQQKYSEKTIAFFIGGTKLFEVLHLPFQYKNHIVYAHSPFLEPLFQTQQESGRFLIVLCDRQRAIFFTFLSK